MVRVVLCRSGALMLSAVEMNMSSGPVMCAGCARKCARRGFGLLPAWIADPDCAKKRPGHLPRPAWIQRGRSLLQR